MRPPLQAWLAAQCRQAEGVEAGLLALQPGPDGAPAISLQWPRPGASPSPRLSATVQAALERGRFCVQEPAAGRTGARTHLAIPIDLEGRTVGAVGLSLEDAGPGRSKAVAEALQAELPWLRDLLATQGQVDRVVSMMTAATRLLDHEGLRAATHGFALELAQRFACERVAVGWLRGRKLRVASLTNAVRLQEESDAVRDVRDAMRESIEQDAFVALPDGSGGSPLETRAHAALMDGTGAGAVCTIPLAARGRAVGAVTFEWAAGEALDASTRERIRELAILCGPLLDLLARAEAGTLDRLRAAFSRWSDHHFGSRRLALGAVGIGLAVVALLAVVPGPYRVSARASLEGRVQRALVAAVPGYVAEANARAGDLVRAGDVLARLDDGDLRLERRKWESRKAQLELEQREALAAQDRTRVRILRAQIDQAAAELALAVESIARTRVVAPFDGIVVEGDLDRSLGSPVDRGRVLFQLAPLDGYRIIVEVDGRDIADVSAGQTGQLTLQALPGRPMPLVVERVTPVATTRDGRSFFRLEAALEEPVGSLRPGMEGIAKIDAGRRRVLWIWTHELLDWLRLRTWSWLP